VSFGLAQRIVDFKNKYCLLCKILKRCKVQKRTAEKSVTSANFLQIILRKIFLRLDIWRFKILRRQLEKQGYDFILSDRCFFDTAVNIDYLCRKNGNLTTCELDSAAIKPDLAIYLKTSPELIMSRERTPDQGVQYLIEKNGLYEARIPAWNMLTIDGNGERANIFEEIKKLSQ
jgi:thymidylate kinase